MASSQSGKTVEEVWPLIQDMINKIIDMVESVEKHMRNTTSKEIMNIYKIVYDIAQRRDDPECQKLYDGHNKVFEDYISSKVMPCLAEKKNKDLLQEVVTRWNNHKLMTKWMKKLFKYLDRYFLERKGLPTLQESSYSIFHKLVLIGDARVMESILHMMDRVSHGEEIDQSLLKAAIDMWVEVGEDYYKKDFEESILQQFHQFHSLQASETMNSNESYRDYMDKLIDSMKPKIKKIDPCLRIEVPTLTPHNRKYRVVRRKITVKVYDDEEMIQQETEYLVQRLQREHI